jgi:hypothetical protein
VFGPNVMGALLGAAAIAAASAYGGWMLRGDMQNSAIGKAYVQFAGEERSIALKREVNLWSLVANAHRAQRDTVDTFQRINEVSGEARIKLEAAMKLERAQADAAMAEALRRMKELGDADGKLVTDWRDGVIPPDITCGVFNGAGCAGVRAPAGGPGGDPGVDVRDGAADAAAGSDS